LSLGYGELETLEVAHSVASKNVVDQVVVQGMVEVVDVQINSDLA
jgi:hypothetical protein